MSLITVSNLLAWSTQIVALVAVALLTLHLLRLDAPAVRYVLLRAILVVSLALPFAQPYSRASAPAPQEPSMAFEAVGPGPAIAARARSQPGVLASVTWTTMLASAFVVGAAVRLAWMAIGVARLGRLRRFGEIAPEADEDSELLRTIGAHPAVRYVRELGQPVTFGFLRPVILLPMSLRQQPP